MCQKMAMTPTILARSIIILAAITLSSCASVSERADSRFPPPFFGLVDQFTLIEPVRETPPMPFLDKDRQTLDISAFRGQVVLVNFWATWCAPCVEEMPALDELQNLRGEDGFTVLALASGRDQLEKAEPFYRQLGLSHLGLYFDPDMQSGYFPAQGRQESGLALFGMPMSYIIDKEGRVRGYLAGTADWTSVEALALIDYFINE